MKKEIEEDKNENPWYFYDSDFDSEILKFFDPYFILILEWASEKENLMKNVVQFS